MMHYWRITNALVLLPYPDFDPTASQYLYLLPATHTCFPPLVPASHHSYLLPATRACPYHTRLLESCYYVPGPTTVPAPPGY